MKEGTTVVNTKEYFKLINSDRINKEHAKERIEEIQDKIKKILADKTCIIDNDCGIFEIITTTYYSETDMIKRLKNRNLFQRIFNL